MPRQYERPVTGSGGSEHHPAFGIARIGRIHATPGAVLFQSDVRHGEYIVITLSEAYRQRDHGHDRVQPGRVLAEFSMSLSQFASFVGGGGTEGVPVTIEYDHGGRPGIAPESRLALTTSEVRSAADTAFRDIQAAEAAYEEVLSRKSPAAERRAALAALRAAIANAVPNVKYAADRLTEHAENVVEKSRADIEAMIASARADVPDPGFRPVRPVRASESQPGITAAARREEDSA